MEQKHVIVYVYSKSNYQLSIMNMRNIDVRHISNKKSECAILDMQVLCYGFLLSRI